MVNYYPNSLPKRSTHFPTSAEVAASLAVRKKKAVTIRTDYRSIGGDTGLLASDPLWPVGSRLVLVSPYPEGPPVDELTGIPYNDLWRAEPYPWDVEQQVYPAPTLQYIHAYQQVRGRPYMYSPSSGQVTSRLSDLEQYTTRGIIGDIRSVPDRVRSVMGGPWWTDAARYTSAGWALYSTFQDPLTQIESGATQVGDWYPLGWDPEEFPTLSRLSSPYAGEALGLLSMFMPVLKWADIAWMLLSALKLPSMPRNLPGHYYPGSYPVWALPDGAQDYPCPVPGAPQGWVRTGFAEGCGNAHVALPGHLPVGITVNWSDVSARNPVPYASYISEDASQVLWQVTGSWFSPTGVIADPVEEPAGNPLELGDTYPYDTGMEDPDSLPSYFPQFDPPSGRTNSISFPSIRLFDKAASEGWSPLIYRQVGPLSSPDVSELSTLDSPLISGLAVGLPLPSQALATEEFPERFVPIEVTTGGARLPPIEGEPIGYAPPGAGAREAKLRGSTHALRMLLMAATYGGGFIRALYNSVDPSPWDRFKPGVRRYDRMLGYIWQNLDRVNWGDFSVRAMEVALKYALEGRLLRQINAASTGSGYGLATQLYHTSSPSFYGPSSSGGAFSGHTDPFVGLSELQRSFNRNVFGFDK